MKTQKKDERKLSLIIESENEDNQNDDNENKVNENSNNLNNYLFDKKKIQMIQLVLIKVINKRIGLVFYLIIY